jgi:hypothetical protein
MTRSPRAHRTYTDQEARTLLQTREELRHGGLDSLIAFMNEQRRPWAEHWPGWKTINGEPFNEDQADECRGEVCGWADRWQAGTLALSMVPVTTWYCLSGRGELDVIGPQHDLAEFVAWLFFEAIRSNQIRELHKCAVCLAAFRAKSNAQYCSKACRSRARARRMGRPSPLSNRDRQARYRLKLFGPLHRRR